MGFENISTGKNNEEEKSYWNAEWKSFHEEFGKETDRAAVILAAAKIDELLRLALTKRLISCPTAQDNLLDSDGPLGPFSSRINMAYRLALIDNDFSRALHLIRKIRNDFAHESSGATLEAGPHADRVRELSLPWRGLLEKAVSIDQNLIRSGMRGLFEFMVMYSIARLNQVVTETNRIEPLPPPTGRFLEPVK